MARIRRFRSLVSLFFGRFLDNDLISIDGDVRATLINVLGLVATPGIILPFLSAITYSRLADQPLWVRDLASFREKGFYLSFSMTVLGMLTVLQWHALFPDRRDYLVLRPFPVSLSSVFGAKMVALAGFWCTFTVAVNAVCSVLFPMIVVQNSDTATFLWFVRGHVVAVLAANAFVFLSLVAVQGILVNCLSVRAFRRISPLMQGALIAGVLAMFFSSGSAMSVIPLSGPATTRLLWCPPAWFLGLYQWELGWTAPAIRELAGLARYSLAAAALLAAVTYALGYRRHVRKSLESSDAPNGAPGALAQWFAGWWNRIALRNPCERAAFHFVAQTLLRSTRHKVLLAAYAGVGFAIAFEWLGGVMLTSRDRWWRESYALLLPAPLVIALFLACGVRYVFTLPAELRANWIFKVSAINHTPRYVTGIRKALAATVVFPMCATVMTIHLLIWPWQMACAHAIYCAALMMVLCDILLAGFEKLPFTCSYVAGRANIRLFWPAYILGFVWYMTAAVSFEVWILKEPSRIVWMLVAAAVIEVLVLAYRRTVTAEFAFIFDDRPEPAVQTLDLAS
jgi:hypothetical protein